MFFSHLFERTNRNLVTSFFLCEKKSCLAPFEVLFFYIISVKGFMLQMHAWFVCSSPLLLQNNFSFFSVFFHYSSNSVFFCFLFSFSLSISREKRVSAYRVSACRRAPRYIQLPKDMKERKRKERRERKKKNPNSTCRNEK